MFTLDKQQLSFSFNHTSNILPTKQPRTLIFGRCDSEADLRLPIPLMSRKHVKLTLLEDDSTEIANISPENEDLLVCVNSIGHIVDKQPLRVKNLSSIMFLYPKNDPKEGYVFEWKAPTLKPLHSTSQTPLRTKAKRMELSGGWIKSFATPQRVRNPLGSPQRVDKLELKQGLKETLKSVFKEDQNPPDTPTIPTSHPSTELLLLSVAKAKPLSENDEPHYLKPTAASTAKHTSPPQVKSLRVPPKTADPVRVRNFPLHRLGAIASPMRARQVRQALMQAALGEVKEVGQEEVLQKPLEQTLESGEQQQAEESIPTTPVPIQPSMQITPNKIKSPTESVSIKKSVRFGPTLQPELFEKDKPPSTPLQRGAKPFGNTPMRTSLLKRTLISIVDESEEKPQRPIKSPKKVIASTSPKSSPPSSPSKLQVAEVAEVKESLSEELIVTPSRPIRSTRLVQSVKVEKVSKATGRAKKRSSLA